MRKQLILTTVVISIIITTSAWLGYSLSQYIINNKYELSHLDDNKKTEKQTEKEIDTEFTNEIIYSIAGNICFSEIKKQCTKYIFKSEEIFLKKISPPPQRL